MRTKRLFGYRARMAKRPGSTPEAVIVAAARSPIGRAYKGSLIDMRADDLALAMASAALAQVPQLDPTTLEDVLLG